MLRLAWRTRRPCGSLKLYEVGVIKAALFDFLAGTALIIGSIKENDDPFEGMKIKLPQG